MKTYKLNKDPITGALSVYLTELEDGIPTGNLIHSVNNQAYLKWLEEGNTPEPADEPQAE